jgi:hypothetical protein
MVCNCGKAKNNFKAIIDQNKVNTSNTPPLSPKIVQPVIPAQPAPITRAEKIRRRQLRIQARNERMARRNQAILAAQKSKEEQEKKS